MITSTANQRVKDALRLRKRRDRDEQREFLIEGGREVARAAAAGVELRHVFACAALQRDDARALLGGLTTEIIDVSVGVFERLSAREGPDGILAVAACFNTELGSLVFREPALVLVVVEIEKPGNLGTMLRTAAATGASVIVADAVTDVFNPNVVRSSQGALFSVPLAVATSTDTLKWLHAQQIAIVATTPSAAVPFWQVPMRGPTAVVIGAEDCGLSDNWLSVADHHAVMPMAGAAAGADSLNASASAAIVLFDAVRQRST